MHEPSDYELGMQVNSNNCDTMFLVKGQDKHNTVSPFQPLCKTESTQPCKGVSEFTKSMCDVH